MNDITKGLMQPPIQRQQSTTFNSLRTALGTSLQDYYQKFNNGGDL